jgi:hypothetical protein
MRAPPQSPTIVIGQLKLANPKLVLSAAEWIANPSPIPNSPFFYFPYQHAGAFKRLV